MCSLVLAITITVYVDDHIGRNLAYSIYTGAMLVSTLATQRRGTATSVALGAPGPRCCRQEAEHHQATAHRLCGLRELRRSHGLCNLLGRVDDDHARVHAHLLDGKWTKWSSRRTYSVFGWLFRFVTGS